MYNSRCARARSRYILRWLSRLTVFPTTRVRQKTYPYSCSRPIFLSCFFFSANKRGARIASVFRRWGGRFFTFFFSYTQRYVCTQRCAFYTSSSSSAPFFAPPPPPPRFSFHAASFRARAIRFNAPSNTGDAARKEELYTRIPYTIRLKIKYHTAAIIYLYVRNIILYVVPSTRKYDMYIYIYVYIIVYWYLR